MIVRRCMLRCFFFRFTHTDFFNHNIIRKLILISWIYGNRFRLRFSRFLHGFQFQVIPLLFLHKGTDILRAFTSENRESCPILEGNIPQADPSGVVIHGINLKLPFLNVQLHTDGEIIFPLVLMYQIMGTVLCFAHQHKVLTVRPDSLSVMRPLPRWKSRHRNALTTFKLFIQELSSKNIRYRLGIVPIELIIAIMLKADKDAYFILLADAVILGFP